MNTRRLQTCAASQLNRQAPPMQPEGTKTVQIELTADEALVLFEFLQRFSESDALTLEDQAEQRALWNLCCMMEKTLAEPFASNYSELLAQARSRLRDDEA